MSGMIAAVSTRSLLEWVVLVGATLAALGAMSRLKFFRWLVRTLVGDPVSEWLKRLWRSMREEEGDPYVSKFSEQISQLSMEVEELQAIRDSGDGQNSLNADHISLMLSRINKIETGVEEHVHWEEQKYREFMTELSAMRQSVSDVALLVANHLAADSRIRVLRRHDDDMDYLRRADDHPDGRSGNSDPEQSGD